MVDPADGAISKEVLLLMCWDHGRAGCRPGGGASGDLSATTEARRSPPPPTWVPQAVHRPCGGLTVAQQVHVRGSIAAPRCPQRDGPTARRACALTLPWLDRARLPRAPLPSGLCHPGHPVCGSLNS